MSRDRPKPTSAFLHGADGPVTIVPARIAWQFIHHADLLGYASKVRGRDEEADNALMAMRIAATWWGQHAASESGSTVDWSAEVPSVSGLMSPKAAGQIIGISDRAVRLACARGRLPALRDDSGRWRIAAADVDNYRRRRAA